MKQIKITEEELSKLLVSAARKGYAQGQRPAGERKMGNVILSCEAVAAGMVQTHGADRHEYPIS